MADVCAKMQARADLPYPFMLDMVSNYVASYSIIKAVSGCTLYTFPKKVRMSVVFPRSADREVYVVDQQKLSSPRSAALSLHKILEEMGGHCVMSQRVQLADPKSETSHKNADEIRAGCFYINKWAPS
eukprot:5525894-Amphidinium_carterae.2